MAIGVDWDRRAKRYRARLTRKNRAFHLGYFETIPEAVEARDLASKQYDSGQKFKYYHTYKIKIPTTQEEGDFYLWKLGIDTPSKRENPIASLKLGVLIQALRDLLGATGGPSGKAHRRDARLWFNAKYPSRPGFSFLEIIECLGMEETIMRKAIRKACHNRKDTLNHMGIRLVRPGARSDNF